MSGGSDTAPVCIDCGGTYLYWLTLLIDELYEGRYKSPHLLLQSDPDHDDRPAVATRVRVIDSHLEQPVHSHRKGQLVVSLHGGVTCEVPDALWIAPPHYGVWVPSGVAHRSRATDNARICFLLIEPGAFDMPAECCTVKIAPMIREMIQHLVDQ